MVCSSAPSPSSFCAVPYRTQKKNEEKNKKEEKKDHPRVRPPRFAFICICVHKYICVCIFEKTHCLHFVFYKKSGGDAAECEARLHGAVHSVNVYDT